MISLFEYSETIPTLWNHVVQYINDNEIKSELLPLLTNKYNWYNLCHFGRILKLQILIYLIMMIMKIFPIFGQFRRVLL